MPDFDFPIFSLLQLKFYKQHPNLPTKTPPFQRFYPFQIFSEELVFFQDDGGVFFGVVDKMNYRGFFKRKYLN